MKNMGLTFFILYCDTVAIMKTSKKGNGSEKSDVWNEMVRHRRRLLES
jgi:hypothetical protein